jgi:hypothetical protein
MAKEIVANQCVTGTAKVIHEIYNRHQKRPEYPTMALLKQSQEDLSILDTILSWFSNVLSDAEYRLFWPNKVLTKEETRCRIVDLIELVNYSVDEMAHKMAKMLVDKENGNESDTKEKNNIDADILNVCDMACEPNVEVETKVKDENSSNTGNAMSVSPALAVAASPMVVVIVGNGNFQGVSNEWIHGFVTGQHVGRYCSK